jgi:hypothetical protein
VLPCGGLPHLLHDDFVLRTTVHRYARATVQRLLEALDRGGDGCRPPALRLLREVFALPVSSPQQLLPPASLTTALLQPLARRLDEPHAPLALQVVFQASLHSCRSFLQADVGP